MELLKDFKPGPLEQYRKKASFDWKKMKIFLLTEEIVRYQVSRECSFCYVHWLFFMWCQLYLLLLFYKKIITYLWLSCSSEWDLGGFREGSHVQSSNGHSHTLRDAWNDKQTTQTFVWVQLLEWCWCNGMSN